MYIVKGALTIVAGKIRTMGTLSRVEGCGFYRLITLSIIFGGCTAMVLSIFWTSLSYKKKKRITKRYIPSDQRVQAICKATNKFQGGASTLVYICLEKCNTKARQFFGVATL